MNAKKSPLRKLWYSENAHPLCLSFFLDERYKDSSFYLLHVPKSVIVFEFALSFQRALLDENKTEV